MIYYRLHHDPKSSHQQISGWVRRAKRGPILDVGAAQGFLGQLLDGSGLVIDAVEPDAECADCAQPFYRHIFRSTIEDTQLPYSTYKTIVCADVLEHLHDPTQMLRELYCAATPDATFIVSLPNVAHLAVRLMLLGGRFPHMERGILDRTHLHFYTLDTARAMLEAAGLEVTRATPTGVPLDEIFPKLQSRRVFGALMKAQHLLLRLAPRVFGFQWVLIAKKAPASAASRKAARILRDAAGYEKVS